ncbi:MAG: hypothetical protein ACK504_02880 [Bacteroidota bacterium]|jgi:hypothetical protein
MKKIILFLLIISSQSLLTQTSVCSQFHRNNCNSSEENNIDGLWIYNSQSKSGLFNQGMTSKIRCVVYKGMDYRINVCCETALGDKLIYKIFDARTSELLYDNSKENNELSFEFQSASTRQLIIELTVPKGSTEEDKHKPLDGACVGLLIEHKITERRGFSAY